MIRVKHVFLTVLAVAALTISIAGCDNQKATTNNDAKKKAQKKVMHALSKKDEAKLIGDITAAVALLEKLGEDTSTLEQGFSGQALTNIVTANKSDMAAGKLKVRVFKNSKYTYSFAAPKIAAVTWTYTDGSYYIDMKTRKALTAPANKKQVFNFAAVKVSDKWKIGQIMTPAKKDSAETTTK